MRHLFLTAVAFGGVAWADDPKPVSDRAKQQVAAELVDKLGSRDFKEREAAEKKLLELGSVVADVVRAGLKSESEEVAARCERILPRLREADLLAADAPAWKRFSKVAGDTDGAKALYCEMVKVPAMAEWLEKIEADPKQVTAAYQAAVDEAAANPPRSWRWSGGSPFVDPPDPRSTFMLYVGGFDGAAKVTGPSRPTEVNGFGMIRGLRPYKLEGQMSDAKGKLVPFPTGPVDEARKLFARWFEVQRGEAALLVGASVATEANLSETVPALKRIVGDKSLSARLRLETATAPVLVGTDVSAEVESLLADKVELLRGEVPEKGESTDLVTVQVRDAAAAVAARSRGYDPADFGFAHFHRVRQGTNWNGRPVSDLGLRYGFSTDSARAKAHDTVNAFLALKPMPTRTKPVSKVVVPPADPPELLAQIAQIEREARAEEVPSARTILDRVYFLDSLYPGHHQRIVYESIRIVLDTGPTSTLGLTDALDRFRRLRTDPLNTVSILRRLADRELDGNGKFALHRANAAGHLLSAYAELHKLELPEKRPELPKVTQPGPDATAKERAEFVVANTARWDAQYVCDLMDSREAVVAKLRELYKADPNELKTLADKKLPKDAVEPLMKAIK